MLSLSSATRAFPDGLALVAEEGDLSYQALRRRAACLEAPLTQLMREHHGPIAFAAHSDVPTLTLLFALFELGIPAFPQNPRLGEVDRRKMADAAGATTVAFSSQGLRCVQRAPTTPCDSKATSAAVIVATSGSSGLPRLVSLSQSALVHAAEASSRVLSWKPNDRWLLSLGLGHIGGLAILVRCLLARKPVILADPSLGVERLAERIVSTSTTLLSLVPTQVDRLLGLAERVRFRSLRAVLVGGGRARPGLARDARRRGLPVLLTYGMSETASQIATQPLEDLRRGSLADDQNVGKPLPNLELEIQSGTIHVRGPSLFDGYLGEQTSPFTHDGWFDTGDMGELRADGRLVLFGRRDDRIVTGGENVAPREVEDVLEQLPEVAAACVVGLADDTWGEIVAAAVVLRPSDLPNGSGPPKARIAALVRESLCSFKRPKLLAYLAKLPLSPNGKVDRRRVASLLERARRAHDVRARDTENPLIPPQDEYDAFRLVDAESVDQ